MKDTKAHAIRSTHVAPKPPKPCRCQQCLGEKLPQGGKLRGSENTSLADVHIIHSG
jgi:hypothetical protein